jgi:hypothetical protein
MINRIFSGSGMLNIFSIGMLLLSISFNSRSQDIEIRQAVEAQIERYPESTLQDIYKSFFQDEFGPGHLLGDSTAAREYLQRELSAMKSKGNYKPEPCGTGENFYRLPMDLVKDGIIPEEVYFEGFMKSSKDFKTPDIESWKKKWVEILEEIEAMDLQIPNLEQDKRAIAASLEQGEAVFHHSDGYGSHYDPHYRIFSKAQWEKLKDY